MLSMSLEMMTMAKLRRIAKQSHWVLWGYLLLVALAEILVTFVSAQLGMVLHALLLVTLIVHCSLGRPYMERRLALALTLAPLTRLLTLALPLAIIPPLARYPVVAIPLLLAAVLIIRQLHLSRAQLGLRSANLPLQLMLMGGGLGLGALEYLILAPAPLITSYTWNRLWLQILSIFIFTGFTEELIFRGLLQSVALPILRRWALVYVALLFAMLHIGNLSFVEVGFVFAVGMIFGYIVRWSGSLLGVSLAHGLTNVTLFLILPYMAQQPAGSVKAIFPVATWSGVLLTGIAMIVIWRTRRYEQLEPLPNAAGSLPKPGGSAASPHGPNLVPRQDASQPVLGVAPRNRPHFRRERYWHVLSYRWSILLMISATTAAVIIGILSIGGPRSIVGGNNLYTASTASPISAAADAANTLPPATAPPLASAAATAPTQEPGPVSPATPPQPFPITVAPPTTAPTGAPTTPTGSPVSASDLLQRVAAAEAALRTGEFVATLDYGNGNLASSLVRFDLDGGDGRLRIYLRTTYTSTSGTQMIERIAIGDKTWQRQPDGVWAIEQQQQEGLGQLQVFLPDTTRISKAELAQDADAAALSWYDAGRDTDVILTVDPTTGMPRELHQRARKGGPGLTVLYYRWNKPIEITPPAGG
jgi:CAAX protease family protein